VGHSLPGAAVVSRGNLLGRVHSLADIFTVKPLWDMTATIDGRAEAVSSEMISGNYYSTLGVQPALGRAIGDADDGEPGSGPVTVISYRYWTTRFVRSPSVIGKVVCHIQ
jgi:hypothetical protein